MGLVKVLTDQSIVSTAEGFGQADITSEAMQSAIESWIAEYFNRLPAKDSDPLHANGVYHCAQVRKRRICRI